MHLLHILTIIPTYKIIQIRHKFTYAEINCTGEGANKKGRVGWEKNLSAKDVKLLIEPKNFIDEDGWMATLPSSLVSLFF